jgi:hypothetical protein
MTVMGCCCRGKVGKSTGSVLLEVGTGDSIRRVKTCSLSCNLGLTEFLVC